MTDRLGEGQAGPSACVCGGMGSEGPAPECPQHGRSIAEWSAALRALEAALAEMTVKYNNLMGDMVVLSESRAEATKAERERIVRVISIEAEIGPWIREHLIRAIRSEVAPHGCTCGETWPCPLHGGPPSPGPCSRGSDGCEIPGRHDMCGMVIRAAIRAPQPPEPRRNPLGIGAPILTDLSPPPPSASGLLLTLKRAANLLDCGAALRTSECSPADPCAACLVHADVEAEIRKLEAPPPSEEPE